MQSETPSNPDRERRLDEVVTSFLKAMEAGEKPAPAQWLERYPDLAKELKSFFAAQEQIVGMAGPLPVNPGSETVGLEGASRESSLGTVRYVGDYELLEEIARGGMGVVYKAKQVSLNRVVALKMILAGQLASKGDVQRFKAEAEAAGKLDHPNIVPIYEVGEHEGQQYFSMKLIEGGSLAAEIARFSDHPREAARLLSVVARAVHHAHQRGILHRDLKPSNILLDAQGQPHVTDFGLAKRVEADSSQTQSGAIVGTPSYMSPEQAQAVKSLTTATDIYGLGGILYILLTGQPPFQASSPLETLLKVVEQETARPRSIAPRVNRDLETICLKCLEKDPAKRYGSAEALADELDRWLRDEPIVARPTGTVERSVKWARRHPAGAALLLVTVLGVAGIVWKYVDAELQRAKAQRAEVLAKANEELAKKNEMEAQDALAEVARQKKVADANWARAEGMLYATNITAAQAAWESKSFLLGHHYLNACRWDLRGWEHDYLYTAFNANQFTFRGHTSTVSCVAFSPDGKQIVSGSAKGILKVWNAVNGREFLTLNGHSGTVWSVAFSSDGKRIFSGSNDGTVKVWNATSGQEIQSLKHSAPVNSMALSPDGLRLVSANQDKVTVWDATKGLELHSFKHVGRVQAFSPDGKRIVGGSDDSTVKVWDAMTGKETLSFKGCTRWPHLAFSPDGKRIVGGGRLGTVKVWDAVSGQEILSLKGHMLVVTGVVFSGDGKRIVSSSADATVKVWDAVGGKEIQNFKGHESNIQCVNISPDGKRIVSGSTDMTVKLWDATRSQETITLAGYNLQFNSVAFSPDAKQIAGGGGDRIVKVWDANSGQSLHTLRGHTDTIYGVDFSPDSKRIVSCSGDKTVKVWDAATGREILALRGHKYVSHAAFSTDGKRIISRGDSLKAWDAASGLEIPLPLKGNANFNFKAAISGDGKHIVSGIHNGTTVKVWDCSTGKEILVLKGHTLEVQCVAFSHDDKRIISGGFDKTVKVWDATSGLELLTLKGHADKVWNVAFSLDGKRIVSRSNTTVKVWDAASGQEIFTIQSYTGEVARLAFSPDSKRIAIGSGTTVKVWDTSSGLETLILKGHTHSVNSVAFSPDGKRIGSASSDQTIKVWDAQKTHESVLLQGHEQYVTSVAFSQDGKRIVSTDGKGDVQSWDIVTGRPIVLCTDAAPKGGPTATSADGALRLIAEGTTVRVVKTATKNQDADREFLNRLNDPEAQLRWHRQEADASEKTSQWFAAAFHLRRLLDAKVTDAEALQSRLKRCEEKLSQP